MALFEVMKACWDEYPGTRPSFFDLSCRLGVFLQEIDDEVRISKENLPTQ